MWREVGLARVTQLGGLHFKINSSQSRSVGLFLGAHSDIPNSPFIPVRSLVPRWEGIEKFKENNLDSY